MACFNDFRSEFIVRILALLQMLLKVANVAMAVLSLVAAWTEERDANSSKDHHCQCVLKSRPASCELIEGDGDKSVALWDPLFVICSVWIGAMNLLMVLRDLRFRSSRFLNGFLFLLSGSIYFGLGDHYDRETILLQGYVACILSLVLILSVPLCGRVKPYAGDEQSGLLDNDEFAQANGVFSNLND
jgi:hypothetical protein